RYAESLANSGSKRLRLVGLHPVGVCAIRSLRHISERGYAARSNSREPDDTESVQARPEFRAFQVKYTSMGLKCGIVGLPIVGKSTLFNALTETAAAQAANYPFCTIEPNVGEVAVPD